MSRLFVSQLGDAIGREVLLRGWIFRLRELARTSFIILQDCTGTVQCVALPSQLDGLGLKLDDAVEVVGVVRSDARAACGFEVDLTSVHPLNRTATPLPFNANADIGDVATEIILEHRPLSLRNPAVGDIFRVQAAILEAYREFLTAEHFTEIVSSKIVAGGTEGGTHLFEIKYFDRVAYLAQSPQFYKEHGVAGFERVFETGHVYRAEPHATSRHLTEYYSLDLEMGFIDGPEDVIALERSLLTHVFDRLNGRFGERFAERGLPQLPSMEDAPTWEFGECLERLAREYGRTDLTDDLDPQGERQLCELAEREAGVPAVFVLGFPLSGRPFYTHPRGEKGAAQSFDLLFRGLEITTGGQRLHRREELEGALRGRGIDPAGFEPHLRMFDLGMPPHGGLAIGLERLTMLVMGLANVREATLYPRDRTRLSP
jgi:nondiscriminating aspartyl-tRNA synthetase